MKNLLITIISIKTMRKLSVKMKTKYVKENNMQTLYVIVNYKGSTKWINSNLECEAGAFDYKKQKVDWCLSKKSKRNEIDILNHRINEIIKNVKVYLYNSNYNISDLKKVKIDALQVVNNDFKDLATDFINKQYKDQYQTIKSSLSILNDFSKYFPNITITDIDNDITDKYFDEIKKLNSDTTIESKFKKLHCLWKGIEYFNKPEINPFKRKNRKGLKKLVTQVDSSSDNRTGKALDLKTFTILKDSLIQDKELRDIRDIFCCLTLSGSIRFTDLALLKVTDVDLNLKEINFVENKTNKLRKLKIPNEYVDFIKGKMIENQNTNCLFNLINIESSDTIEDIGRKITSSTTKFNRALKKITKLLKIKHISSHINRHTFASIALNNLDMNVNEIQNMMNHSSPVTTYKYYIADNKEYTMRLIDRFQNNYFNNCA